MRTTGSLLIAVLLAAMPVSAGVIQTQASGDMFGDSYGFLFEIFDDSDAFLFHARLTNTSPADSDENPLIDRFAFNMGMDANMTDDFEVINVNPAWQVSEAGGGIQFDFVGDPDSQDQRLPAGGGMLTFDFNFFTEDFTPSFDLWLNAPTSTGGGFGGGDEEGQVAVSFQRLGQGGGGSDLLTSLWGPGDLQVPEPITLLLVGSGLLGMAALGRRRTPR